MIVLPVGDIGFLRAIAARFLEQRQRIVTRGGLRKHGQLVGDPTIFPA
jgi:hypothetical protein